MHVCSNVKVVYVHGFVVVLSFVNLISLMCCSRNGAERSTKKLDEFPKICWDTPVRHTHTQTGDLCAQQMQLIIIFN